MEMLLDVAAIMRQTHREAKSNVAGGVITWIFSGGLSGLAIRRRSGSELYIIQLID